MNCSFTEAFDKTAPSRKNALVNSDSLPTDVGCCSDGYPEPSSSSNSFQSRRQTKMGKARTLSEPSYSEVELLCSHFASPCIARCCQSQSDPDELDDEVFLHEPEAAHVLDPLMLPFRTKIPPDDIGLPLWDNHLNDDVISELGIDLKPSLKSSDRFSSRESSYRGDRNFFAENSCNNTVIHISGGRSGNSSSNRKPFGGVIAERHCDILESGKDNDMSCQKRQSDYKPKPEDGHNIVLEVPKKPKSCHAKGVTCKLSPFPTGDEEEELEEGGDEGDIGEGESDHEGWALEDQFQTKVRSTVESQLLATATMEGVIQSSGNNFQCLQTEDFPQAVPSGDFDCHGGLGAYASTHRTKEYLWKTPSEELRDDACEKPSLKKNWSNFMPAVGDTICYMQNSASSESRPQAARLGTGQGAGAAGSGSDTYLKPGLMEGATDSYYYYEEEEGEGVTTTTTGDSSTGYASDRILQRRGPYGEKGKTNLHNINEEKEREGDETSRRSDPSKPKSPTPVLSTGKALPNTPAMPADLIPDQEIVYTNNFHLHLSAYRFRNNALHNSLKRLKEDFDSTSGQNENEDEFVRYLSKQLGIMEKHSSEDQSVNNLAFKSKIKPNEIVKKMVFQLSEELGGVTRETTPVIKKPWFDGHKFSVLCELAFAVLIVIIGVQIGILWHEQL